VVLKTKSPFLLIALLLAVLVFSGMDIACSVKPDAEIPSQPVLTPRTSVTLTGVQFLGHACFLITSSGGLRIITDPYTTNNVFIYAPVDEIADIVTVSHEHQDHNNISAIKGQFEIIKGVGSKNVRGIDVTGVASYHDDSGGKQRGANTIFCFPVDGVRFCHLGDLGHRLNSDQLAAIGKVDVLFIPVGGGPTIDSKTATEVCNDLKPRVIIPMHYKTPKTSFNLASVDDFLAGKSNLKKLNASVFEIRSGSLPASSEIVVLETAR
jgi:L-ascorbate metabolism protein UlaG (beta-lactamase superfamily)